MFEALILIGFFGAVLSGLLPEDKPTSPTDNENQEAAVKVRGGSSARRSRSSRDCHLRLDQMQTRRAA